MQCFILNLQGPMLSNGALENLLLRDSTGEQSMKLKSTNVIRGFIFAVAVFLRDVMNFLILLI